MDHFNAEFWRSQRVLVTGGAGFLGRHLVARLTTVGCADVAVPRRRDFDFRRIDDVRRIYRDVGPTLVIHLAALVGGIGANRERPAEFFYDNLMMGTQLLDEAWRAGVAKFVAIGTVCAYPKHTPTPFHEDDLWLGYPEETNAPYGLAKKMLLVQSEAYRRQYGFNSIFVLPANLYGPGDNFDERTSHVLPALIRRAVAAVERGDQELTAWGDGSATRDFLYVDDAATAILLAAERYDAAAPVNIGSGRELSVRDLVGQVAAEVGFTGRIVWDPSQPNGQPRRSLDVSKAAALFGFRAETPFETGLRRTVEWYRRTRGARP